jgi:hypothetical protein
MFVSNDGAQHCSNGFRFQHLIEDVDGFEGFHDLVFSSGTSLNPHLTDDAGVSLPPDEVHDLRKRIGCLVFPPACCGVAAQVDAFDAVDRVGALGAEPYRNLRAAVQSG